MDDRLESMYRRFTWRILSNYVSPWEFEQLRGQVTDYEQWCAAWSRQAEGHLRRGDEALAAGRRLTAGDAYLRAGLFYHWASFMFCHDQDQFRAALAAMAGAWEKAIIDALAGRADLDAGRLAVGGISYGGLFAIRTAATDERVRAVVSISSWYSPAGRFETMEPLSRTGQYQHLGPDPAAVMASITLAGAAGQAVVPLLQVYGGLDPASPPAQAQLVAAEYGGPVTTLVFDDGVHILNNIWFKARPAVADWLTETL